MGYMLAINNESETIKYWGSKHYGYNFIHGHYWAEECLKYASYRYLKDLGKVDGYETWDYGLSNLITLTASEFEHFIKLYDAELVYHLLDDEDIKALLKDKENKIVYWM